MAQVYLAKQKGMDGFEKVVVIKRILPHLAESQDFVRMFLDEARTAADLRHANIVNIYEIGEAEGTYYMAMEFLHGKDIRRIQASAEQRGEAIPIPITMEILRQAAMGLHYAHVKTDLKGQSLNIVHRDISPHNLIVTFEGTCKVVDFGIAKAESQTQQTASGVLKGKYSYMSPEQASGKPLTALSDQYALGICAWEMLMMKRLFRRENEIMTLHAIIANEIPLPSSIIPDFPTALEEIVLKMLAPNATDRYESCQEAALAIEDFLVSERMPHSAVRVSQYLTNLFEEELNKEEETGKVSLGNSSASVSEQFSGVNDPATEAFGGSILSQEEAATEVERGSSTPQIFDRSNATLHSAPTGFEDGDLTERSQGHSMVTMRSKVEYTEVTKSQTGAAPNLTDVVPEKKSASPRNLVLLAGVVVFAIAIGWSQREPDPQEVTPPKQELNSQPPAQEPQVAPTKPEPTPAAKHVLVVTSQPPGASIRFSGRDLGTAPVSIPVTPSALPFEVEGYLRGYGLLKTTCFVKPDQAKAETPCLLKFNKQEAPKKAKKATSKAPPVKKATPQAPPPPPAPAAPAKRPKLKLID